MTTRPVETVQRVAADAAAMEALGAWLVSRELTRLGIVYLRGELGAGKTTLVRGILRALGHAGPVKSPTFTLIEPYDLGEIQIYHLDLYRLEDPEELSFLGLRDYMDGNSLMLVEWPEKGAGFLPPPDIAVNIQALDGGRAVVIEAVSPGGQEWIKFLD